MARLLLERLRSLFSGWRVRKSGLLLFVFCLLAGTQAHERFHHQIAMTARDSGNYYVSARFETGDAADMLVDTGSGFVALSRSTFRPLKSLPSTTFVRHTQATLASGDTTRLAIYRIAELTLGQDCVVRDLEVAVLPGRAKNILGLSALRQVQPFAMSFEPPALFLSHCSD